MKLINALLTLALAFATTVTHASDRPNVLFIFADDQCYKTIGSLNNSEIKTDPEEMNDLASRPGSEARMQTLFATLLNLQKENGDRLVLTDLYPKQAK